MISTSSAAARSIRRRTASPRSAASTTRVSAARRATPSDVSPSGGSSRAASTTSASTLRHRTPATAAPAARPSPAPPSSPRRGRPSSAARARPSPRARRPSAGLASCTRASRSRPCAGSPRERSPATPRRLALRVSLLPGFPGRRDDSVTSQPTFTGGAPDDVGQRRARDRVRDGDAIARHAPEDVGARPLLAPVALRLGQQRPAPAASAACPRPRPADPARAPPSGSPAIPPGPATSSKNQPQLAYMSSVARCSSSSRRAASRASRRPPSSAGRANFASARSRAGGGSSTTLAVGVARRPGIAEQLAGRVLVERAPRRRGSMSSACAQRPAPGLVPPAFGPPMLQPQSRCQRPSPCPQLQAVPSPSGPVGQLRLPGRRVVAPGRRPGSSPRIPRRAASTRVANASVRSANFLWWPHSSPSDAHSTSRCAARRASGRRRPAPRPAGSRARLAVSPNATRARQRAVEHAERDRAARAVAVPPAGSRGPVSSAVAVDLRSTRRAPARAPPRSARAPGSCSGRRARSASPAWRATTAVSGSHSPSARAAEAPVESRQAPEQLRARDRAALHSGTIGCA